MSIRTWAGDVGRSYEMLRVYRHIWERFGDKFTCQAPDCPTFTAAWQEVVPGDKPDAVAKRVSEMHLQRASPEVKAETAVGLLQDPDVMRRVVERSSPVSRALGEAIDTQRALHEVEQAIEDSGEPTESYETFERRVAERMADDAAMQHDLAMKRLSEYLAAYSPTEVAEAILASPHTTSIAGYRSGAESAARWFGEFLDALTEQSRPRLVSAE